MIEIDGIGLLDERVADLAGRCENLAQQVPGAVADHRLDHRRVERRAAEIGEHPVEPGGDIGRGVGERAVQIEGDDVEGRSGHPPPATGRYGNGKLSVASAAP
jgi:hypothetical protein